MFAHVSTIYVNCNLNNGQVEEKIYPLDQIQVDFETQIKNMMKMPDKEVHINEKNLISGFPNTYTFTKNLAERYIEKYHGDLKTVIFRPSIIAGSKI